MIVSRYSNAFLLRLWFISVLQTVGLSFYIWKPTFFTKDLQLAIYPSVNFHKSFFFPRLFFFSVSSLSTNDCLSHTILSALRNETGMPFFLFSIIFLWWKVFKVFPYILKQTNYLYRVKLVRKTVIVVIIYRMEFHFTFDLQIWGTIQTVFFLFFDGLFNRILRHTRVSVPCHRSRRQVEIAVDSF